MKKAYQSPRIKVIKIKTQQMLCTSFSAQQQNESYIEVSEETTDSWF